MFLESSEKCILVVLYGVLNPGACLFVSGKAIGPVYETEYVQTGAWTRVFPDNAIAELLRRSGLTIERVDYVVIAGKPLSYFERLLHIHMFFFPGLFRDFFADFKDLFINKIRIKHLLLKNISYAGDVCYIEPTDAFACQIAGTGLKDNGFVLVSLSQTMGYRTLGCYKKEGGHVILIKELAYPSSLLLLRDLGAIGDNGKAIKADNLVKMFDDGSFVLNRKILRYDGATVRVNNGSGVTADPPGNCLFEKALCNMINSIICSPGDSVIFASDYAVDRQCVERLQTRFSGLSFFELSGADIYACARNYAVNSIFG